MLAKTALLYTALGVAPSFSLAQEVQAGVSAGSACVELARNAQFVTVVKAQALGDALSKYLRGGANPAEEECAGIAFSIRAAFFAVSGRLDEAEFDAQRSLDILGKSHSSNDRILLRPLHTLAVVRFELGKVAQARQANRRLQLIHTERPEEQAIVHTMSGTLLRADGRLKEAESEYLEALEMIREAGRGESADAASTLNALALAYIEGRQYDEARRALDSQMAILQTAKDGVAMDRIAVLAALGALHFRLHQWLDAEQDLGEALSIADRDNLLYPALAAKLLPGYAIVLRKVHRRTEARSIEARAATYRHHVTGDALVDVSELAAKSRLK